MKLCNGNTWTITLQKQPPEVFYKKSALRNFTKFTGKHLCLSLFFNKVGGLGPATISKKRLVQVLTFEFWEISKNIFSTEHLWETASDIKFIYIENVVRLVLFVVLLWLPKIWFDKWFFIFLVMVTSRGIIFICRVALVSAIFCDIFAQIFLITRHYFELSLISYVIKCTLLFPQGFSSCERTDFK